MTFASVDISPITALDGVTTPVALGSVVATADGIVLLTLSLAIDFTGESVKVLLTLDGVEVEGSSRLYSDDHGYYAGSISFVGQLSVTKGNVLGVTVAPTGGDADVISGHLDANYIQTAPSYQAVLASNSGTASYSRQIATAARLTANKGRACVWKQYEASAPADTDKPWKPGASVPTPHDVNIVFLPQSGQNSAFLRALTGTDIPVGDDYGLMAAVDFVPTTKAEIYAADGTTLLRTVKGFGLLAPDGDPILYTLYFGVDA